MNRRQHKSLFIQPKQKPEAVRKKVFQILWKAFQRTCFSVGLMVVVSVFLGLFLTSSLTQDIQPPKLPEKMVLYIQLDDGLLERPKEASFAEPFAESPPTVAQLVRALDDAARDDRVAGLFLRMNDGAYSLAHVQELRAAVLRFKATGKFTRIYATSYGGAAGGLGRFYLASAFDERWMQPLGVVSIAGVRAEVPYLRSVLDKIGVEPNFFQRKDYKTAYESFTHEKMSPQNREALGQLVQGMRTAVLADVPSALGFSGRDFETLMDQGLFTAPEALEEGLITHADYVDVLIASIKEEVLGSKAKEQDHSLFVPVQHYGAVMDAHRRDGLGFGKPRVAVIYVHGAIMESGLGDGIAAADQVAPVIIKAAQDEDIQAIVLRVDSPGGSPAASESILRAVQRAQEKGKKVIVSMGTVAASGGYWVSSYADQVFALPTTITGSIGVVGGKFSAQALWQNIGVHWDKSVQWGENAGMWSMNTPFSDGEAAAVNAMLDHVYISFLERVAQGRKMDVDAVDEIAGGRVWSGVDAQVVGLVDQIGGLKEALDYTARQLGAEDQRGIAVVELPRPLHPFEALLERLSGGRLFEGFEVVIRLLKSASLFNALYDGNAVLAYDPVIVRD